MSDLISRQAAIDDIWTVSPIAKLDREWIDRWLRQLPSAPLHIDADGTLWITVSDIEQVKRVIVDEEKSKFCRQFYMDARPETTTMTVGRTKGGITMWYECDNCGEPVDQRDNYCPNCGRKFRKNE